VPRDVGLYLEDMIEAASRVQEYLRGVSSAQFARDPRTVDAVVRNLEILGEAAKGVPEAMRQRAPTVEWRKIAGLRDVLAHAYFQVDLDIVWDAATNKVPGLVEPVRRLLAELGSG